MPRVYKPKNINELDAPRRRLYEYIEAVGTDLATLSKQIGKNSTYLWQYMRRNNPQSLPEEVRHELEAVTGIPEPEWRGERLAQLTKPAASPPSHEMLTIAPDLPLKGRVVPGADFLVWEGGRVQRMVNRPAILATARNGFDADVYDESMSPRYEPGERVHVDPDRPLSRNCYVFIVKTDDTAIIRQYLGFEDSSLSVRTLKDHGIITIPRSDIQLLGRIVGSSE